MSDSWDVLDLSRRELLVGRIPSRSICISPISSHPRVELVVLSGFVVHDGVVPWVLVVVTVGVAAVITMVRAEAVARSVVHSVVITCVLSGRDGACKESEREEHLI